VIQHKITVAQINEWFALGLTPTQVNEMDDLGIYAHTNNSGSKLAFGDAGHPIVKDMPIKSGTLKMAQEGMLPAAILSSIGPQLKGALSICLTQLGKTPKWSDADTNAMNESLKAEAGSIAEPNKADDFEESFASSMIDEPDDIAAEEAMEGTAFDKKVHGEPIEEAPPPLTEFSVEQALKMHKVKLANANTMYQPVNGTSESSVYHCIGLVDGHKLKFGARWTGNNLSIRVEGPVAVHSTALIAAGFNESYIENGYTSVHFNGIDELTARRCIGAVLSGTGFKFVTPMPNIDVIGQVGT
jgi:hypothetical protein